MEQPARKRLRLQGFAYDASGTYFITVCTQEKACILSTIVGADANIGPTQPAPIGDNAPNGSNPTPYPALTPIGLVEEKYLCSMPGVGRYVIMPNHVHLMVHISAETPQQGPMWASAPTRGDVPSLIRSWKTLVTKDLGKSIWQRSYYDYVIRNEQDYWLHVQYIDENPAKWFYDDYYIP